MFCVFLLLKHGDNLYKHVFLPSCSAIVQEYLFAALKVLGTYIFSFIETVHEIYYNNSVNLFVYIFICLYLTHKYFRITK